METGLQIVAEPAEAHVLRGLIEALSTCEPIAGSDRKVAMRPRGSRRVLYAPGSLDRCPSPNLSDDRSAAVRWIGDVVDSRSGGADVTYGVEGDVAHDGGRPVWWAAPVMAPGPGMAFDLFIGGTAAGRWRCGMPGLANLRLGLGALAWIAGEEGRGVQHFAQVIECYRGIPGRQEFVGSVAGVFVYEDCIGTRAPDRAGRDDRAGALSVLTAIRQTHGSARVWAVVESALDGIGRALSTRTEDALDVIDGVGIDCPDTNVRLARFLRGVGEGDVVVVFCVRPEGRLTDEVLVSLASRLL